MPKKSRKSKQNVKLQPTMEGLVLRGMLVGELPVGLVEPEELSPAGAQIQAVLRTLGSAPGLDATIAGLVTSGVSESEARRQVLELERLDTSAASTEVLLQRVRDKHSVNNLLVEAMNQLSTGEINVSGLLSRLREDVEDSQVNPLVPVSETYGTGEWPDPATGWYLDSFPRLSHDSGGMQGLWAVAGPPGCGKSTWAWQVAIECGHPVLYYDFENSLPVLMGRTKVAYADSMDSVRKRLETFYYRDSISTLEVDIGKVPPPALIVVDSLQKLPAVLEYRRTSLDQWLYRLEAIKKQGYRVLMVSEVNRAAYKEAPHQGIFKETGEVEYTADFGFQLKPEPNSSAFVQIFCVKNRHRPRLGYLGSWIRASEWKFTEGASPQSGPIAPNTGVSPAKNPLEGWNG